MLRFYRAGGSGSDTTAFCPPHQSLFCFLQPGQCPATYHNRIPHGFECLLSVCPGLQRAHVLFRRRVWSSNPRCGLIRRLQCPGFISGTLQLSNIRNLLRRHVMELTCHRVSPRRSSRFEGFRRLVHLPRRMRGETRHLWLIASNCSPPRTTGILPAPSVTRWSG